MSQNDAAERALQRGANFNWGYRLGQRQLEMEMSGKARPKAPTAATKRMLAEFPPSEADLDLRQLLKEFSDVELWEGACALAEETAALRHAPQESIADWCRRVLRNSGGPEAPPGAGASGGAREYPGGPAQEPYATGGRSLNLAGWAQVHVRPLRALSLALGASLTALDLSGTAVDDRALETLCARLFALRALRLGGCDRLSNLACQAVAAATHATLTQLDISGCGRLSHEACGWLAGELGSGAPRCARLQSLNVARCAKMNDQALRYAAAGLRRLAFVSVAQNEHVGDVGVCTLAKHCRRLEVLDVSGCPRVGDRSLKALGRHCHGLRVLIAPRCGSDTLGPTLQRTVVEFTDAGARALARGCSRLASLNVAGARRLSEAAFGELATACRALGTLDCTGCDEVTVNGLRSLVEGVGFVREATSFFGFVPLPADVARDALRRQQGDLEHRSARTIQNAFSKHRAHVAAVRVGWLVRRTRNAELIQRFAIRWLRERRHAEKRYQIRRVSATLSVQRVVARGVRARRRSTLLADTRSSLRAQFDHIVAFQALWRGYRARARDEQCVAHAVRRLRGARRRARRSACATRVAAAARGCGARRRARVLQQIRARRNDDVEWAAVRCQHEVRAVLARWRADRLRESRDRATRLRNAAARIVQRFFQKVVGSSLLDRIRAELARRAALREASARFVQMWTRGFFGRQEARRRRAALAARERGATALQRVARGSRVLAWRHIKMNKIAADVFRRREFERGARVLSVEARSAAWSAALQRDSASDDDDSAGQAWVEQYDGLAQRRTWVNSRTGEVADHDAGVPDPVDAELVGCSVRVLWPQEDTWYEGHVTKFNRKRKKYRVDYLDGDHEWLDFDREKERLQLFDGRSQWAMLSGAFRPELEFRRAQDVDKAALAKRAQQLEAESQFWEVLLDAPDVLRDDSVLTVHTDATTFSGDAPPPPQRWLNTRTGQTRVLGDDAAWWFEARDADGNFCFEHGETGEQVYKDPRFAPDAPLPKQAAAMDACLDELRFASYVAAAFVGEWDAAQGASADAGKARTAVLKRLDKLRKVVRSLRHAVNAARELWPGDAFGESEELVYAAHMLTRVNRMRDISLAASAEEVLVKRHLIAASRRSGSSVCGECGHDVPQSKTHCEFCGTRCTYGAQSALAKVPQLPQAEAAQP